MSSESVVLTCSLDRALETVELKPTYEDLFQVENSSVEDYLKQMHEVTVLTAIQVPFALFQATP